VFGHGARRHGSIPVCRRFFEVRHNFPNLWSRCHVTVPAAFGETPQRIRKPNRRGILRFGWAQPSNHRPSQLRLLDTTKWGFTCEDLEKVYVKVAIAVTLLAYLEDNQSKCVDVRLRPRHRTFHTKIRRHEEFWGHECHRTVHQQHAARQPLTRIEDGGHKCEAREASTRRGVVGHEDVHLFSVKGGLIAKRRNSDPIEVPMYEIDAVEVL